MPLKLQLGLYTSFPRTTRDCDLLNAAELNGDEITLLRVIHLNQIGIKSFKQTPTNHPQQPTNTGISPDTKRTKFKYEKEIYTCKPYRFIRF